MVFLMSITVVPLGVLAAFYLREYAKQGPVVRPARDAPSPSTRGSPTRSRRSTGCRSGAGSKLALKDISLDIPEKKITAFIGPSGCGKSTLLCCINRLNDPRSPRRASRS